MTVRPPPRSKGEVVVVVVVEEGEEGDIESEVRCEETHPELMVSAFNRLRHYASSPGNRIYCYAELAVTTLAVAETITSTYCAYPVRTEGWQGCGRRGWLVKYQDGRPSWSPILVLTWHVVE